jgi:hypothetical protein
MRQVLLAILAVFTIGAVAVSAQDCSGPEPSACPLLNTAKVIFVGSVTENEKDWPTTRFRVSEAFKGVQGDVVDVDKGLHEFGFEVGKQYLVFAVPCIWQSAGKGCLMNAICGGTRALNDAAAVLQQLRAEKSGKQVAAVYGMLVSRLGEVRADRNEVQERPLPNILIKLQSDKKSFETSTDAQGAYAFGSVPPGKYQVSADLPADRVLGNVIGNDSVQPFELPRRCCFENNLYALPSGRITGEVIGPDGKALRLVVVHLFPASRYKPGENGSYSLQGQGGPTGGWKPFEFDHLAGGDYVLVMNPKNEADPDAPFATTFYPQSANIEGAQVIHLADGQQLSGADIHVENPMATRQVTLRLAWGNRRPQDFYPPQVTVMATRGRNPFPEKVGEAAYRMNVLLNGRYAIRVQAFCKMGTKGKAMTDNVAVDGSDLSVSEIVMRFDEGQCARE